MAQALVTSRLEMTTSESNRQPINLLYAYQRKADHRGQYPEPFPSNT